MAVHPATASAPQVTGAIRQAAQSTGISFEYLLTTAKIESNFNPTAQASTSSAKGLYQFIDQTWLGTMKQDALAKAETAWRHFTCCVSALSPEQPRRYGKPFMSKRLSIYNRLPTTRAATQRSLVLTDYCWSTNNDTAPQPCLLKAKAHSSHAVADIHACKAAALDGGRAAARACSCCRRGCRSAS
jgi:hypothetical protein